MNEKFPTYKFNDSDVEYQVITKENSHTLAEYMINNSLKKMIITSSEDGIGWNDIILPDLKEFDFLEELLVYWTNVKDIKGVHYCKNLKVLWLDNDDKTAIDFLKFPYLEKLVSWERKNIEKIWDVSTIKELSLIGLKPKQFYAGETLKSIEKLRILKTPITDISFLEKSNDLKFLELLDLSKIEDLSPIKSLTKLNHLRIKANKVSDFSFLNNLINLETLYLSSKIGVFKDEYFSELKKLRKVNLSGNPSIQSFNRDLQKRFVKS